MALPRKAYPSQSKDHKDLLVCLGEYRNEATEARRTRLERNKVNWDVYMGNVDWSHKMEGQSTEHLPKLANSAEQMTAFVKRALTQFGPWFSMQLPKGGPLTDEQARGLLTRFLGKLVISREKSSDFQTLVGDAVKQALMESLIILKVHGTYLTERSFKVEPANLLAGIPASLADEENDVWNLRIDLVSSEDYLPDPTGRGLYEIHRVERDWIDVWRLSQGPGAIYDPKIVEHIHDEMQKDERGQLKARHKGQDETTKPARRKRLVVEELWGTILGPDGRPTAEGCVAAFANEKWVIREPGKNPFWHGESPFVAAPIQRVPGSVWHKALFDSASQLNIALDELFNLIIDGGLASVWGVRQVRESWLADPRQISAGIPQGATLLVSDDAPTDGKVVEQVATGKVPPEALAVYQTGDREYQQASLGSDVRLGNLPQRQTKATEIVHAEQNSSVLLDSFAGDLETAVISPVLRKAWLCIMQFADDIPAQDVIDAIGPRAAFTLSRMSEAQRYATFARASFKVSGLSETLAKSREFQKLMAMQQGISTNPVLMQAFLARFSGDRILTHIMRSLNINPEDIEMDEEELARSGQTMSEVQQLSQITGGGSPAGPNGGGDAGSSSRAEINQDAAPTSGVG